MVRKNSVPSQRRSTLGRERSWGGERLPKRSRLAYHELQPLRRPVECGQYAIYPYRKVLAARGITMSMSRKGNCWDNAPMESVNGTIKVECVRGARFKTRAEAARELMQYFGYYNTERLHSSLGYMTPSAFELRWQSEATDDEAARVAHRRPASCSNDATRRPAVDNACARGRGVH
jgi:hypothetical protein